MCGDGTIACNNKNIVWGLIASQYIANVLLLILSTVFIPIFVRAVRIPYFSQHSRVTDIRQ